MNTKRITRVSSLLIALNCFILARVSNASIYGVSNTNSSGPGSLSQALSQAQSDSNATINVSPGLGTITLSGPLPAIQNNLVINGNSNAISGGNSYRIFFVNAPGATAQINDLALSGGLAQGGAGGVGWGAGGGGAGLGGAIFLNAGNLTVKGVSFSGNSAKGGAGGIGFDDGVNESAGGGGGGGGLAFNGGAAEGAQNSLGYPGFSGPGGGGGALTSAGLIGYTSNLFAGMGGGVNGGAGGVNTNAGYAGNGASPLLADAGGGGGGWGTGYAFPGNGGNGGDFGGGGGSGGCANENGAAGGSGGFGGGGGGSGSCPETAGPGGQGGFGGGGGGGGSNPYEYSVGEGGAGGFGAGAGADGTNGDGGGGFGAGGAIFARAGSFLTIQDSTFESDSVVGGSAAIASNGLAIGQALFLGANVNYSVSIGTNTLTETIGGGNDTNAEGGFTKSGAGTFVLAAAESYVGPTTVNAGTLEITSNVLLSSAITINSNAVLDYDFINEVFQPTAIFSGAGTLRVSGGTVVFGPGTINVNFSPGSLVDVESGKLVGSSSYGGRWTQNQAALNVASGALFDAVEAGNTGAMQIDALTGAGTFEGGFNGNANGLSTVTIGIAGGSGTFSGILENDTYARLGVVKAGAGTETFSGASNTYSGGTTVEAGTLVINGTAGSGAVNVSGGILAGTGTIAGPVTIGTNGALAPGTPVGTMTIKNTLSLSGKTCVALNSGVNSKVAGLTSVSFGGTLSVTNLGGPLSAGNTFMLFGAGSFTGNFTNIAGNAGDGLSFNFNPTNGVLSVESNYPTSPTSLTYNVSASALTVSWAANYTGWILQAQTNPPSMGITTNWVDVAGSASVDSMSFALSRTNNVFFRLRLP